MTIFISIIDDETLLIQVRAEGKDIVGDLVRVVSEGQSFGGVSYEQSCAAAPGQMEID